MIIGLIGYKGSGKDVMADYLVSHYNFEKMAFADPLKDICRFLFDLSETQLTDRKLKEQKIEFWSLSPREILQKVGTDLFRKHFDAEFWVKLMENKISQKLEKNPNLNIVCSDVRFQNEANLILKLGGKIVYIDRFNCPNDSHESEQVVISTIDYKICNKATLQEYYEKINEYMLNFF
jgi:hypothetical protein